MPQRKPDLEHLVVGNRGFVPERSGRIAVYAQINVDKVSCARFFNSDMGCLSVETSSELEHEFSGYDRAIRRLITLGVTYRVRRQALSQVSARLVREGLHRHLYVVMPENEVLRRLYATDVRLPGAPTSSCRTTASSPVQRPTSRTSPSPGP